MGTVEIVLLVIGVCIFVVSFLLPAMNESDTSVAKEMARMEVKNLVAEEMEQIKQQVDDTVEEAVGYAMEKTERSLERISNEKIMAVNEYSDTVLAEINKNHQEVMFLYDMLNDKHTSLKKTVTVVEKKAKEAEAIAKEAFKNLSPEKIEIPAKKEKTKEAEKEITKEAIKESDARKNCNESILKLHKQGHDKVQIARMLGIGVGEVELVIGLFKEKKL